MRHFCQRFLELLRDSTVIDTGHSGGCELAQGERIASDGIAAHNAVTAICTTDAVIGLKLKAWNITFIGCCFNFGIAHLRQNPSPLLELLNVGHFNGIRWRWCRLAASYD